MQRNSSAADGVARLAAETTIAQFIVDEIIRVN